MFKSIKENIQYILLLIPSSLRMAMGDKRAFFTLSIFMFLQNMIMFMIWVIYFTNFSSLKGWHLEDLAVLYGLAAFSFGSAFLFSGGTLDIGRMIVGGDVDIYLGRPRHPLPGLMFREARAAGFGDIITGPVLWVVFGHCDAGGVALLMLLGLFSSLIILSTALIINCLPFYNDKGSFLTDQLLESFIIISTYPHNGFPVAVKVLLLTLIPAGFVAFLPVEAFRTGNGMQMVVLAAASLVYLTLAVAIFNRGLRRYSSGNRMLEVR